VANPCNKPLKTNPFISLRDPQTGEWRVVKINPRNRQAFLGIKTNRSVFLSTNTLVHRPALG
jgi:hypothetical protein